MPDSDYIEASRETTDYKKTDLLKKYDQLSRAIMTKNKIGGLLIREDSPTNEQIQTNKVVNGLGRKIMETCNRCLRYQGPDQEQYLAAADVLLLFAESLDRVGAGTITFHHMEQQETASGGKVQYFESDIYYANNKETKMVIQVRPYDDTAESKSKKVLKAQARTNFIIKSADLPHGEAGIRIDPPDRHSGNNIVYDISIGRSDQKHSTMFDVLNLKQRAGHHFSSGIRLEELHGIGIPEIHKTISAKLEKLVK